MAFWTLWAPTVIEDQLLLSSWELYLIHSFTCLFVCLFVRSFVCMSIHSLTHSLMSCLLFFPICPYLAPWFLTRRWWWLCFTGACLCLLFFAFLCWNNKQQQQHQGSLVGKSPDSDARVWVWDSDARQASILSLKNYLWDHADCIGKTQLSSASTHQEERSNKNPHLHPMTPPHVVQQNHH